MTDLQSEKYLVDRQKEHFNSIAETYEAARSHENHLYIKELIWHHCLKDITLPKKDRYNLLEAMCGFAEGRRLIPEHMKINVHYSGYDYSDVVVDKLQKENHDINVWQADATEWEPEEKEYDIVLLIGGLHHVPDHAQDVVKKLSLGLKSGGLFINFEPTYGNPLTQWIRKKIYEKNTLFDEVTERDFSVRELSGFFEQAGLQKMRMTYPGLLAYILFYNPDAFPLLNFGNKWFVRFAFFIDRLFYKNIVGRWMSFATLSVWKNNE